MSLEKKRGPPLTYGETILKEKRNLFQMKRRKQARETRSGGVEESRQQNHQIVPGKGEDRVPAAIRARRGTCRSRSRTRCSPPRPYRWTGTGTSRTPRPYSSPGTHTVLLRPAELNFQRTTLGFKTLYLLLDVHIFEEATFFLDFI